MALARRIAPQLQLTDAIDSWLLSLEAANKSPRTLQGYGDSAGRFAAFLDEHGLPLAVERIERPHVEAFIADQLARHKPSTAWTRYRSLGVLFKWLLLEGEIERDPMATMKPPAIPEEPVGALPLEDVRKLLKVTGGKSFEDRRDHALILTFADCGIRLSELAGLNVEDVQFRALEKVLVVLGKGRRPRRVGMGHTLALALDRYVRLRASHRDADRPEFWLGLGGPMTTSGIAQVLRRRCDEAGIPRTHPHALRHTVADQARRNGMDDAALMSMMGWRSRSMLQRYAAAEAASRAIEAQRRVSLGDRL